MQVKRMNPLRRFFAIRGMASAMIAFIWAMRDSSLVC